MLELVNTANIGKVLSFLQGVTVQHFIGGLVYLPAVLRIGDEATAASLACLGILSKMGWEIQDLLRWIYKRIFYSDGKAKVPGALLIILAVHHSMTTILGLPMVLHYRNLRALHWLCFDLQAATAVSLMVTEYTKLLDVSKLNQLRQFQAFTFVALTVMVWTRGVHWVYLCSNLVSIWYTEKAWSFLVIGSLISVIFSLFNWVFCIEPFYKRFIKFIKISAEYKALPADADPSRRRSSVEQLQAAAADLLVHHQIEEELAELFVPRKVDRRGTVPPSMFSKSRSRRASNVLLRSSASDISHLLSQLDD